MSIHFSKGIHLRKSSQFPNRSLFALSGKALAGLVLLAAMVVSGTVELRGQGSGCWGNFRGDAELTGVSRASIPDQPALLWNFKMEDGIKAAPVACDGIVVVGTLRGTLYAVNSDGTLRWKIITENSIEAPALIIDGMVYVGNLDGALYAVDLKSGAIRWTYRAENQIMGSAAYYSKGDRKVLMVGSYDYYLHGIDPLTGEGLWKYETNNYINGSCAIYAGMAVFGGCDGLLHMVDVLTGKARITMEISTYVASSATISGDMAFVGDYDGRFSAVDLLNQKVAWVFANREANLPFIASPAASGEHVYIGNRDKYLYCLNKNSGELVWNYNTGARVDASAVVIGERLLAANMRGDLFLMDRKTGAPLWTYELGTPVNANPAVTGSRFYVAGEDGRLYCFGK